MKPARLALPLFVLLLALVVGIVFVPTGSNALALAPAEAVAQAWQNAHASGVYDYRSTVQQTTYPAPMLSNAGRLPRAEDLAIAGRFDQWSETLDFTLWRDGSFSPNSGLTVKVENGQAYARMGNGRWKEVDDFSGSFAPGGDPLGFLTGITNIQAGGTQTYNYDSPVSNSVDPLPSSPGFGGGDSSPTNWPNNQSLTSSTLNSSLLTLNYTTYTFDLNGPAFAVYMRDQLEQELAAQGKLPRGLSLDTAEAYRQMTGHGTLWVDANGLPARLQIEVDFGAQANGERVTANLQTDFMGFDLARVKQAQTPLTTDPGTWWQAQWQSLDAKAVREFALSVSMVLLVAVGAYLLVTARRHRHFYTLLVMAVIFGMVIVPLVDAQTTYAFTQAQSAQQAEHAAQVAQADAQLQAQEKVKNQWNPHVDPLAQVDSKKLEVNSEQSTDSTSHFSLITDYSNPLAVRASTSITSTDTDNDGLSDADEDLWYTCAYVGATNCSGVANPTDTDGDGLTDGAEVNSLGTLPKYVDTDGDTISDTLEVRGFFYNGQRWYLNPNETDTNSDGLSDTMDCQIWSANLTTYNANGVCPDTDNDGTPDAFDDDNDGDGVTDGDDASPNLVKGSYTDASPFKLSINSLQTNKPVLLTLQFRPTISDHLMYSGRILDWPTGDTDGQVTRYLNTTFANTADTSIRSTNAQAAYGDVRVIPLLEITMPYNNGHYANLPVKPAYQGISRTLGVTVGQWLDTTLLDAYGISVKDSDTNSGELVAYVPINKVTNTTGDKTVAFSAQMFYSPTQVNWGAAQEFRIIWMVQMIVDECVDPNADPATCTRQDNGTTVIQTYNETWNMTGLDVSEEQGVDVRLLYENPAQDPDLSLDHQLWAYSWNMSNNFINGRDCDSVVSGSCVGNGQRDVTVANLNTVVPTWSNSNYVSVTNLYRYVHSGYLPIIAMTETKAILNSTFAAYTSSTYPTFMFAEEFNQRTANMHDTVATFAGQNLTINFATLVTETVTALSWASYEYVNGAWTNIDQEDYLTYLDNQLAYESYFQAADSSEASADEAEGKRMWAQAYYVGLARGLTGLAAVNNSTIWTFDNSEEPTMSYVSAAASTGFGGLGAVAGLVSVAFAKALWSTIVKTFQGKVTTFWQVFKSSFTTSLNKSYGLARYARLQGWAGRMFSGMAMFAVVGVLAVAGAALYLAGYFTDDQTLMKVGSILLTVSTLVLQVFWLGTLVVKAAIAQLSAVFGNLTRLTKFTKTLRVSALVGLIVGVLMAVGMFAYLWASGQIKPGTVAFSLALAYTIASIIVLVLQFILQMVFPIAGTILLAILALIDLILQLFGEQTITDRVTQVIADWLYDVDYIIANLDDSERLDLDPGTMDFIDAEQGFRVGNGFYYSTVVTSTLVGTNDASSGEAKRATVQYVVQLSDTDQDEALAQGQMRSAWTVLKERTYEYENQYTVWVTPTEIMLTATAGLTTPLIFSSFDTGLNRNFSGRLYLTEGYAIPYQGCWQAVGFDVECDWDDFNGSNHLNLGADLVFDVFPATLDQFVALTWNSEGALSFPTQTDMDADGLLSTGQGGTDPSDATEDADGDGLSDVYELTYGLNTQDVDGDDDGLSDYQEVAYYITNPLDADSDDDGLPDYTEVKTGWLVVYTYAGTTPLLTRVWSDPLLADEDEDTLTDLEEFTFGYNPHVESDPSAIKNIVAFDNMGVTEADSALGLWRFEESAGLSAVADSSGAGYGLNCDRAANQCPTLGVSGRYGNAAQFDGVNDQLTTTLALTLSTHDFTLAAWVKTTGVNQGIITKNDGDTTWEIGEKSFYINGSGQPTMVGTANNFIRSTQAVNDGQWHHVAVVWDYSGSGASGTGKMYVDGVNVTGVSDYDANPGDFVTTTLRVGRSNHNPGEAQNYFNGRLDEVVGFARALSPSEVHALMRGRYNPDDGLLAPGQTLNYHATITNTHASQTANGHLVGANMYADPVVAEPDLVLRFEDTDYVSRLTNSVSETTTLYCLGDGTCPTVAREGTNGQGLDFDGVNDVVYLPPMSEQVSAHSLAFWLKLNALPAAGTTQQIFATNRNENGAANAYIDSSGKLWFTVQGNVGDYYVGTYTSTVGGPWTGAHYASRPMTDNVGTWMHYVFVYYTNNGTNGSSEIVINGVQDSFLNYSLAQYLRLGPGTIGNNSAGTAPLNADFDEFVVYDNEQLSDNTNSVGQIDTVNVMNGNYWLYEEIGNVSDKVPSAVFKFSDELGYNGTLFYDTDGTNGMDNAYCSGTNCPMLTTGYSGNGALFDGVNDYLTTTAGHGDRNIGVSFYFKMNSWPATGTVAYILDSSGASDLYVNANGKLVLTNTPNGTPLVSNSTITIGQWVNVGVQFGDFEPSCTWNYQGRIYINGVVDNYNNYHCSSSNHGYSMTFGPGRIGQGITGTSTLSGTLDSYGIGGALYTFEIDDPVAVEELDHLGGDNAACTEFVNCPTITTGKYGYGLAFSGDDYLTLEAESKYDYDAVSVGAWIKVPPGGFTATWQSIVTKGDSAWRLMRYNNTSRVVFSTNGLSNIDLPGTSNVDDGQWHYVMGVYDGAAKYIYVDGVLENQVTVTGSLAKNNYPVWIGENAQIPNRRFVGSMDEVIVLPEAVYTDGVQALMNTRYPPIIIDADFITYTAPALTTVVVSGTASVESTAQTSVQKFSEEAEAALALQSAITIPVVDNSPSLLKGYFPFEDVPGSTTFDNLITSNDATCSGTTCPVAGLRGVSDRAAYFDGINDRLTISTTNFPDAVVGTTMAMWVKADRGTLVDTFQSNLLEGAQLDVNRFHFRFRDSSNHYTRYTIGFDLPENEWTHLATTVNFTTQVASVYINGSLVATTTFAYNASYTSIPPAYMFGANRYGGDYLHGYLDDARFYNQPLTASQIQTLYTQSTPAMRFEFDEDDTATTYADATPFGAVGYPSTQSCADFSLRTATVNTKTAAAKTLAVLLDTEYLLYDTITNVISSTTRNLDSVICATTPLTAAIYTSGGTTITLGSTALNPVISGTFTQTFTNSGNSVTLNWTVGAAYNQPDPAPGTDGQIGNTGLFNGSTSVIAITPTLSTLANSPAGYTSTFTIMAWVNPDNVTGTKIILGTGRNNSDNGFSFRLNNDDLQLSAHGLADFNATSVALESNLWQHVVVVFDSSYDASFYVDGLLKQTVTGNSPLVQNTDDRLYIGGVLAGSALTELFGGQIDELVVYSRTLSSAEIYSLYLRELRWYRDRSTTYLTVDTNAPTVSLLSTYAYRPNAYTQLAVGAEDTTSNIGLVDFGLKAPSVSTYTWSNAPVCLDAAATSATWCPAFDPSTLNGEGAYQLQFRAVDVVGNEITSTVYTLYVDDTPPTPSSAYAGTWINSTTAANDTLSWSLPLSGTISDPNISGGATPGSGVNANAVEVSLVDRRGEVLGGTSQRATVVGNTWSLTYTHSGIRPSGVYTIQVYAEDNMGNAVTTTLGSGLRALQSVRAPQAIGTVQLDERAPAVQFAAWAYPTMSLTTTTVLTGLVGDYADWGGERVQLHFEETSGNRFYDYSGFDYVGQCITCPTQTTGVFGNARQFSATTRTAITLPTSIGFEITNTTLAAWVKPTWVSGSNGYNPAIMAVRSLTATRWSWHIKDNYSGLDLWNGSTVRTVNVTLTPNQWYHLALVLNNGTWTAYVNGLPMGTVTQSVGATTGLPLNIGASTSSGEFFTGALDEVTLFSRALSEEEVFALAQKDVTGVSRVQLGLEVFSFTGITNTFTWQTATLSGGNALLTNWAYTVPASLEDFYQINVRAQDGFSNTRESTIWRGIIDELAPRVTFTATQAGGGLAAHTLYTFTVNDKFLDTTNLSQPCAAASLVYTTYSAISLRTSGASANACRVSGFQSGPVTLTACDIFGRCTAQTITLTAPSAVSAITIFTPTAKAIYTTPPPTIGGGAYAPSGIQTVTVKVDGTDLAVLPFSGTLTNTLWSTAWSPSISKTYTLTAVMNTVSGGPYTDTITVTYKLADQCYTEITGDNVTDYSSADASALRNAIAAASAGDTVKVAGTCAGVATLGGSTQVAIITKTLTVQGGYAPTAWTDAYPITQAATLDAAGAGHVLSVTAPATLENLQITNGKVTEWHGAGIYATQALTLTNLTVYSNTANGLGNVFPLGGGAYLGGPTRISATSFISNSSTGSGGRGGGAYFANTSTLTDVTFARNSASSQGGGLYAIGVTYAAHSQFWQNTAGSSAGGAYFAYDTFLTNTTFLTNSASVHSGGAEFNFVGRTASVLSSTFSANTAGNGVGGGATFFMLAAVTNTTFSSNTAGSAGGGAFIFYPATLTGTTFMSNTAGNSGGGFSANNALTVTNTLVKNNRATNGGGVYISNTDSNARRFTNTLFAGNTATSTLGSALYHNATSPLYLLHVTMVSPTVVSGSAFYLNANAMVGITNTLIASHTVGIERVGGTVYENYNLFSDVATAYSGAVNSGGNSRNGAALFYDTTWYTLTANSRALDFGANAGVTTDFFGDPRPQGTGYDVGYDEAPFSGFGFACYATPNNGVTVFGTSDAGALRAALAAAAPTATVKVAGYCPGTLAQGGTTQVALITQTLTLAGGYHPSDWTVAYPLTQVTTLDAQNAGRVLSVTAPATLTNLVLSNGTITNAAGGGLYTAQPITLTGLTFSRNTVTGTTGTRQGGGAYLAASGAISGTAFLTNTAYNSGGGLQMVAGGYLTNTTFVGNTATNDEGGGLRIASGSTTSASGLSFYNNRALAGGGGAASWDGPGQLYNSQVVSNSASGQGGGVYFHLAAFVSNTTFFSNTTGTFGRGGGVAFNNTATITNVTLSGNVALGSSSGGGAYFNNTATVNGATFTNNTSAVEGGGAYFNGTALLANATFTGNTSTGRGGGAYFFNSASITSTTFASNSSGTEGGGVYFFSTGSVTNTIFSANRASRGGGVGFGGWATNSQGNFVNTLLTANEATANQGAAIHAQSNGNDDTLTLRHLTIASPTVGSGSAVYLASGVAYITNTLVASYSVGLENAGGTLSENYNFFSGVTTRYSGAITPGANSYTGTAGFYDTTWYTLTLASQALDGGVNAAINADYFGDLRPQGDGYDIGYDEAPYSRPYACYATPDNGTTVFRANDASALRAALAVAAPNATVKVAGYCAGVSGGQVAAITQTLTVRGGYTVTDWLQSNLLNVTTLDAQGLGRVVSLTVPATLENLWLTNGYVLNGAGGGLYTAQPITLTSVTFYSNTATGTTNSRFGGGAYVGGTAQISGTAFLTNTAYNTGGGLHLAAGGYLTNTSFVGNTATNDEGGGLRIVTTGTVSANGLSFYNNRALAGGGGAISWDGPGQLYNSQVVSNSASNFGGGIYFHIAAEVSNTLFSHNRALGTSGGGAYFNNTANLTATTFNSNTAPSTGGGAFFNNTANISASTFQSNTLISNVVTSNGGGGYFVTTAALTNSVFTNNTAPGLGGGGYFFIGTATLSGTTFSGNTAGSNGGGAYFVSAVTLTNTTFSRNTALSGTGGGFRANNGSAGVNLYNVQVLSNTAATGAGGAFLSSSNTLVVGGRFENNWTITGTTFGAGAAYFARSFVVTGTAFISNTTGGPGGAVAVDFGASNNPSGIIANSLFARNTSTTGQGMALATDTTGVIRLVHNTVVTEASAPGSAIATSISGTLYLTNTLIGNYSVGLNNAAGTLNENYNLFDNVTTPYSGSVVSGGNSLTGTAAFYDTTAYTLTASSAALDTGINAGIHTDYFGDVRPQGNGYDIGYDEAPYALVHLITPTTGMGGAIAPATPQTVAHGSAITFTMTPDTGYHILDVGVDGVSQGPITNYSFSNVTADHTITAAFALNTYTLTPTAGANGSITPNTPQTVSYGSSFTFTITPDPNYHIAEVMVDGVSVGAVSTYTFSNIAADHSLSATFALDTFVITPTAGTGGSISPSTPQTVNHGSSLTFTITPDTGYSIVGVWVDGVSVGAVSAYTFTNITANHTLSAAFALNTYTLTPTAGTGGSISPSTPQTVNYGSSLTFTITPNTGYSIAGVWVDGVAQGVITSYAFTNIAANHTLSAAFTINTYTLTVATAGTGSGVVTPTVGVYTYTHGTVVTLTASANIGSSFVGWSGSCSGTGICPVTMTTTRNVTATFTLNTYTITPTAGAGGSISPSTPQTVNHGSSLTFTITPNTGYSIAGVWVDGVAQGIISSYAFTNVTANHTISAAFTINTYTLTVATAGTGSGVVTPTVGVYTYTYGTVVTLTASANTSSTFTGWSGSCSGTGSCVVTMTANRSVTATFDVNAYKIYGPFIVK